MLAALLIGLALAMPQARAELRGKLHVLVNPDDPREQWRRVPLPDAYVVAYWSVTVPAPAHAMTMCPYSELARSDSNGEYAMEGPNFVTAQLGNVSFMVYSKGLEYISFPYGGSPRSASDITMAKSTLEPDERLSRLALLADPPCFDTKLNDPRALIGAYLGSLLEEARSLGIESTRGRNDLRHIESAARRASGPDQRGPIEPVIVPSPGRRQSSSSRPDQRP